MYPVDYGGYAAFLHFQDDVARFPVAVFIGTKQGAAAEIVRETAISHWLSAFGAPDFSITDKDL